MISGHHQGDHHDYAFSTILNELDMLCKKILRPLNFDLPFLFTKKQLWAYLLSVANPGNLQCTYVYPFSDFLHHKPTKQIITLGGPRTKICSIKQHSVYKHTINWMVNIFTTIFKCQRTFRKQKSVWIELETMTSFPNVKWMQGLWTERTPSTNDENQFQSKVERKKRQQH